MTNVDLYEEPQGAFHYFPYEPGVKNARADAVALCGRPKEGLRHAAWFAAGDSRGGVHYERACDTCRKELVE